jgi:hypothetical protein
MTSNTANERLRNGVMPVRSNNIARRFARRVLAVDMCGGY